MFFFENEALRSESVNILLPKYMSYKKQRVNIITKELINLHLMDFTALLYWSDNKKNDVERAQGNCLNKDHLYTINRE